MCIAIVSAVCVIVGAYLPRRVPAPAVCEWNHDAWCWYSFLTLSLLLLFRHVHTQHCVYDAFGALAKRIDEESTRAGLQPSPLLASIAVECQTTVSVGEHPIVQRDREREG